MERIKRDASSDSHHAHNLIEDDAQIHGYDPKLDMEHNETLSSNMSVNQEQRDRAMTLGSFRDRAFTLGSEFDLSTDPGIGDSFLMTGNHTMEESLQHITPSGPSGTVISITSTSSSRGPVYPDMNVNVVSLGLRSSLPSNQSDAFDRTLDQIGRTTNTITYSSHNFPQDRISNPLLDSQTPSIDLANSYELNHFGKRMRSGTISGRLRAMSDLDIDGHQKGILKDLIISGDDALQTALDQYEQGDTTQLEHMIKSGALNNKSNSDIDILGDLDLDFLTVHEDMGSSVAGSFTFHTGNKSVPIPIKRISGRNPCLEIGIERKWIGRDRTSSYSTADDGVGELEFNGDYTGATDSDDYLQLIGNSFQLQPQISTAPPSHNFTLSRPELTDTSRYRSNSLAFGGIMDDEPVSDDEQTPVGRWMDRTLPMDLPHTESSKPLKKRISAGLSSNYISSSNQSKRETRQLVRVKADLMAEKKREREEMKAIKEREKQERKLQKAKYMREKKKEEDNRKEKKTTAEKKNKKKHVASIEEESSSEEYEIDDQSQTVIASGSGRPRALSDPHLSVTIDEYGLLNVSGPSDWVGAYSPDSRKIRIERFLAKRDHRVWIKKVKYDVRKNFADSRLRVKGRFVKKEDELLMRDLMSLT